MEKKKQKRRSSAQRKTNFQLTKIIGYAPHPELDLHLINEKFEKLATESTSKNLFMELIHRCRVEEKLNTERDSINRICILLLCCNLMTFMKGWNNDLQKVEDQLCNLARGMTDDYAEKTAIDIFASYLHLRRDPVGELGMSFGRLEEALQLARQTEPCEATVYILHYAGMAHWIWNQAKPGVCMKHAIQYFKMSADHAKSMIEQGKTYMQNFRLRNFLFLIQAKMASPWNYDIDIVKSCMARSVSLQKDECDGIKSMIKTAWQYAKDIKIDEKQYYDSHFRNQILHVEILFLLKGLQGDHIDHFKAHLLLGKYRNEFQNLRTKYNTQIRPSLDFFQKLFAYVDECIMISLEIELSSSHESSDISSPESDVQL